MRVAASVYHYVGAGNGDELLQNLAGIVVVPVEEPQQDAEAEAAAAHGGAETKEEATADSTAAATSDDVLPATERYRTALDPSRASSSNIITSPPVPLTPEYSPGGNFYDFPRTTRARLRHDREQLAYLSSSAAPCQISLAPEIARPAVAAYDAVLAELGGLDSSTTDSGDGGGDGGDGGGCDGGVGGGGGRTGSGDSRGEADEAWLRDADAYMSVPILLNTSQQVKLAPYYNREMSRRDEPRIPGRVFKNASTCPPSRASRV